MVTTTPRRRLASEGGFTLVEFMVAGLITIAVVGSAVLLATQMQSVYTTQLDDATVEEEARFALDWIAQALRNADTNPYDISSLLTSCAATAGEPVGIDIDPADSGTVRIRADINPPNGLIGGTAAACDEGGEDVTIAHDPAAMVITREDNSGTDGPITMTEPIIQDLVFTFLDSSRTVTTNEALITFVKVQIVGQSQVYNANFGEGATATLETEVRVRTR